MFHLTISATSCMDGSVVVFCMDPSIREEDYVRDVLPSKFKTQVELDAFVNSFKEMDLVPCSPVHVFQQATKLGLAMKESEKSMVAKSRKFLDQELSKSIKDKTNN